MLNEIVGIVLIFVLLVTGIIAIVYAEKERKKIIKEKQHYHKLINGIFMNTENLIYMLETINREHKELLLLNINKKKGEEKK